jgi:hypothetical protein
MCMYGCAHLLTYIRADICMCMYVCLPDDQFLSVEGSVLAVVINCNVYEDEVSCMYMNISIRMCISISICTYKYMFLRVCICVCAYVHLRIRVFANV